MLHQPERKEKDCLNCSTIVQGRYCHQCGQANILPHQNFWSLTRHFIYDVMHFDGKFFESLKHLLFRPGHVAKQYVRGKRASYLDPIRMYLFTSAIFFLAFFGLNKIEFNEKRDSGDIRLTRAQRFEYAAVLNQKAKTGNTDSTFRQQLTYLLDTTFHIDFKADSSKKITDSTFPVQYSDRNYLMVARKIRASPSKFSEDNWLQRNLHDKWSAYMKKYGDDERLVAASFLDSVVHRLPYVLFLSLPFFALILKLLYIRRKNFFYSDHAVFTLYHYIFSFILLLIYFFVDELEDWSGFGFLNFIATLLIIAGGIHLLVAMKRFYGQSNGKTFGKFVMLNLLGFIVISILMVGLFIFSIFQL